jgi:hypothetical protein
MCASGKPTTLPSPISDGRAWHRERLSYQMNANTHDRQPIAPMPRSPYQAQPSKSFLRVSSPYHVPLGPLGAKHSQYQLFPPCPIRRQSNASSESLPSPSSRHRTTKSRVSNRVFPIHDDSGTDADVVLFTRKAKHYVPLRRSQLASPDNHTSSEDKNPIFASATDPENQQLHNPPTFHSSLARPTPGPTSHDQTISVDPRDSDNSDARSLNKAIPPTTERSNDETKNKSPKEHRPTTRPGNCQSLHRVNFSMKIYRVDSLLHMIRR